jgi:hypothetical protein
MDAQTALYADHLHAGVFTFLRQYLERLGGTHFDPAFFEEWYSAFESYHLSDSVACVVTLPLSNFSSDRERTQFPPDGRIVRLTGDDLARLGARLPRYWGIAATPVGLAVVARIFGSGCAIQVDLEAPKGEPIPVEQALPRAERVLTVLRLLKPGYVFCDAAFAEPHGFHPRWTVPAGEHIHPLMPVLMPTRPGESMQFSAEDAALCAELWNKLKAALGAKARARLELAIRRFNEAYHRQEPEDKLLDIAVALETTLLVDTDKELGHRLALRGAQLLQSSRAPGKTHRLLEKFYSQRGKIVHAGRRLPSWVLVDPGQGLKLRPVQFADEIHALCREVLTAVVESVAQGTDIPGLIRQLDDDVVSCLGRPRPDAHRDP